MSHTVITNRQQYHADLVATVRRLQRDYDRVYPWMLCAAMPLSRSEPSYRRDMAHLARRGYLYRVGGWSARKGYRAPKKPLYLPPHLDECPRLSH